MKHTVALLLLVLALPATAGDPREGCPLKGKWLFDPQRAAAQAVTEEERARISKRGPFIREYTCTDKRGYFPDDTPEEIAELEWEPYQIKSNNNGVLVMPIPPYDLEHRITLAGDCFWFSTNLNEEKHYYCRIP
jgi:hypothetical protein